MKKVAFIFPGQGSQYVGMGKSLYDHFSQVREVFAEADEALGYKLSSLCFEGPEAELNLTANTQPAILMVSVAAYRVLSAAINIEPAVLAGHSLGEYSALVAVGAFDLVDAVKAVQKRGQYMQEAVPEGQGGMVAVLGLERDKVEEICQKATSDGEIASPANFNCPGQLVISGQIPALKRAITLAQEMGARKAIMLPVSAPFHCPLMIPAGERLRHYLGSVPVKPLAYPIVTNVEAKENQEVSRVKDLLVEQVTHTVLWEDSVHCMIERGVDTFVEIGPGKVLSGLVKRISKSATVLNLEDIRTLDALEKQWKEVY
ncbi:MAG: ACP S-malonyltransferase [Deltaproteobacteria bacterium]|nr:ACP S-malonyltransferase [Deltaproteobacteria bacterium]